MLTASSLGGSALYCPEPRQKRKLFLEKISQPEFNDPQTTPTAHPICRSVRSELGLDSQATMIGGNWTICPSVAACVGPFDNTSCVKFLSKDHRYICSCRKICLENPRQRWDMLRPAMLIRY